MKKIWSKKAAVSLLVIASTAANIYYWHKKEAALASRPVKVSTAHSKHSLVKAADFSEINNELQVCYKSFLTRDHDLDEGQVLFHLKINDDGAVSFLELVHSDFTEDQFVQCVTEKVKDMRAPASAERVGVLIAHTFKFKRNDRTSMEFE